MQPYFVPYIGYWQLISAVDAFVVYDDVNFTRGGGWINRNYILSQCQRQRITLELSGASQNLLINEVSVGAMTDKLVTSIRQSYAKAPQREAVLPLIVDILSSEERILARFLYASIVRLGEFMGMKPRWLLSSELPNGSRELRGQDRILAICGQLDATHYINAPGGASLYDRDTFGQHNLHLSFLQPRSIVYRQNCPEFVPNLSIIDVLMWNSLDEVRNLLREWDLN